MTRPIKLKDAVQIQLSYHLPREAGWQSGHAAVCNTVYAGSIPTPASNFSSPAPTRHHTQNQRRRPLSTTLALIRRQTYRVAQPT